MVSVIASRKYERAALSRLFRFTLAIQPTAQAEHRSDREVTMWPSRCSRPRAFSLTGSWDRHYDICTSSRSSGGSSNRSSPVAARWYSRRWTLWLTPGNARCREGSSDFGPSPGRRG
jgi:hypothetical protein